MHLLLQFIWINMATGAKVGRLVQRRLSVTGLAASLVH